MVRFADEVLAPEVFAEEGFSLPLSPLSPPAFPCLVREAVSVASQYRSADAPGQVGVSQVPDPFDDADALDELEEEITTLAAHIHAATHRLLTLIAEFDRRRGWHLGGHRSCAHWLSYRTGIDLGTAREKVRTARALTGLPQTNAAMARGELSFSQVRALSRVATDENEADLLDYARHSTTAQLERMVRAFRKGSREEEAEWARRRFESRTFSVFPDEDGMYLVRGRLTAEVGALLMRAIEAASDQIFREKRVGESKTHSRVSPETSGAKDETSRADAARRRADALGLLADRALAAGFGDRRGGAGVGAGAAAGTGDEAADGDGDDHDRAPGSGPNQAPICGTRADRYQVMLHVEAETLLAEGEGGRSELDDGTRVSAETSQRLSCDAGLVRVIHGPDGSVLDVGRKTRTIPNSLRRALEVRDQGCRFPGCGLRFTEGHHVKHWAQGGETSLGNTLLLCGHHHTLVHEGGWTVDWWGKGRPVFFDPRGGTHFDGRWRAPELRKGPEKPLESAEEGEASAQNLTAALIEQNRNHGIEPDGWTASARWRREADIPDSVYFRAMEALG